MKKNLILLGMMGVGKTTLGKIVAKKLKYNFFDIDKLIEKQNTMKIKEIFEKKGEKFFRNEEEKITLKYLENTNSVISLGGGAFMNSKIKEKVLLNSVSIWLYLNIKNLNLRLNKNKKRPLLEKSNNSKTIAKIYNNRKSTYKLANYSIDCNNLGVKQIVKKIINIYEYNQIKN